MSTRFLGNESFKWFVGKVEDRDDPYSIGRVKVRIYNVHSDKKSVAPTSELPWAFVMSSINSASVDGVGIAPVGMMIGSVVVGFFMDSDNKNYPVIIGTLPGLSEDLSGATKVPRDAIGTSSVVKEVEGIEPKSAYAARYPYNKVIRTESGHIIELDDTPSAERIHIYHKSGTYIEINNEGRLVKKTVGDDFEVVIKDKNIEVKGELNIHATGAVTISSDAAVILNP